MKNFKEFLNEDVIQQTSTADSAATTDSGTTQSTDSGATQLESGTTECATTEISDDILKELENILPNLDKLKDTIGQIVAKMNEKNGGQQSSEEQSGQSD